MRYTALFCGLVLVSWSAPVHAQGVKKQITQAQAEVHCKPGERNDTIFVTNILNPGDSVDVVEEDASGWLKILPPDGSFSWVKKKDVESRQPQYPNSYTVTNPQGTKTVIGSNKTPDKMGGVFGATLPQGTQLVTIQRPSLFDDNKEEWLPFTPLRVGSTQHPPEFRYLRGEAIRPIITTVQATQIVPVASSYPGTSTSYSQPAPNTLPPYVAGTIPPPPPPSEAQKLWQQAQHAERGGDLNQAMDLYSQMAMRTPSTSFDHDLAMQGLNRVYFLRESQRSPVMNTVPAIQPSPPPSLVSNEARYNGQPLGTPAVKLATPMTSTGSSFLPANPYPPSSQQPTVANNYPSPWQPGGQPARNTYSTPCVGRLIRAGRAYSGRKTYVFMQQNAEPGHDAYRCYASPQVGVDLEPYLNKNVELFGQAEYNGELRANYMIVEQVRVVP